MTAELIVIVLILIIIVPILLTQFLRKKYPRILWIGITLATALCPIGQWYLGNALPWVICLFLFHVLARIIIVNLAIVWIATSLLSGMIMYYRLLRTPKILQTNP